MSKLKGLLVCKHAGRNNRYNQIIQDETTYTNVQWRLIREAREAQPTQTLEVNMEVKQFNVKKKNYLIAYNVYFLIVISPL